MCETCEGTGCIHCGGPEFDYHTACIPCPDCPDGNAMQVQQEENRPQNGRCLFPTYLWLRDLPDES